MWFPRIMEWWEVHQVSWLLTQVISRCFNKHVFTLPWSYALELLLSLPNPSLSRSGWTSSTPGDLQPCLQSVILSCLRRELMGKWVFSSSYWGTLIYTLRPQIMIYISLVPTQPRAFHCFCSIIIGPDFARLLSLPTKARWKNVPVA